MIVLYWSVEYLATLVETILCCILAKIFIKSESVNDKNSKTRMFVYSCLASVIVMTVNKMELFSFINGILGIIMLFLLQCIIYRQRYNILLLSTLIYAVIDSAIDFVIAQMGGILMSLKISYLLNEQSLERCGCVFISKLILCILIYLIYKYNYEINSVYYCTDNVIIDNFEVKKLPKERYIVMDYFILDMKDKKITLYDESINDSFVSSIKNIKKIDVLKNGLTKTIVIIGEEGNMIIKLDLNDRIIEVDNETLKNVSGDYLSMTKYIDKLYLNNVIEVGNNFLSKNKSLSKISMDNVKVIGNNFLESNNNIEEVSFLNVEKIGNGFMFQNNNPKLKKIYIPKVEIVGNSFMFRNNSVMEVFMPSVKSIGNNFFDSNQIVRTLEIPLAEKIGDNFLENNGLINELYLPSTINIGSNFLKQNQMLEKLIIPNVIELKSGTLQHNNNLKELYAPRVVKIGNNVLELNNSLTEFESLYLEEVGDNFLKYNRWLEKFIAPNLRKIGLYILSSNNVLFDVDISSLIDEYKDNLSKYMKEMLKQETPYTLKLKY